MSLLSAANLHITLGERRVVEDVSFDLAPGEFIGLIGPNGAGKSSLLRGLMGIIPIDGVVRFDGTDTSRLDAKSLALKAAYVAQSRDVAWPIAVEELVALGRTPHLQRFAPLAATDHDAVNRAIDQLDIEALRRRPATELSGGELARVLIARALAQDAPLLLADEPTAGLDPAHQIALMHLFSGLAASGRGIIASTHDLSLAARFCTRILILDQCRLIADGPPDEVLTAENLATVYGVRAFFGAADGKAVVAPIDLADNAPPSNRVR